MEKWEHKGEPCPVCGEAMEGCDDYNYDPYYHAESHWACPKHHYGEDYAYGASREWVGWREWTSSYRTPMEVLTEQSEQMRRAIEWQKNPIVEWLFQTGRKFNLWWYTSDGPRFPWLYETKRRIRKWWRRKVLHKTYTSPIDEWMDE